MFSIIIPSWNNLVLLQLCIGSIRKNSRHKHEIIVHVNEGKDGTAEWLAKEGILFTMSEKNIGICTAVNKAAALSTGTYVVYLNDDMYVCPDWDEEILREIRALDTRNFMFSATMIEPRSTGNPCVINAGYGTDIHNFKEEKLIREYKQLEKADWSGSAWPPTIVHKEYWDLVGGYSIEFSPGMSSDDDFAMKMWQVGCRIFKGIGKSKVYHFQAKSTGRIKKNNGRKQFLMKWGMNQSTFNKHFLKRGQPYDGLLSAPPAGVLKKELLRAWLKRKIY
jgi:glycosyltransferase involved in cell wall biosynthesis